MGPASTASACCCRFCLLQRSAGASRRLHPGPCGNRDHRVSRLASPVRISESTRAANSDSPGVQGAERFAFEALARLDLLSIFLTVLARSGSILAAVLAIAGIA